MSSSAPEDIKTTTVSAEGVEMALALPVGAVQEPKEALPPIELSGFPGAHVVLASGFRSAGGISIHTACVSAPSERWAPGVEELLLGRASVAARISMGTEFQRWDAGALKRDGERFEQTFIGLGNREKQPIEVHGQHTLGFVGETRRATLCTVFCEQPAGGHRCKTLIEGTEVRGEFVGAPQPSVFVRSVLLAAERPLEATAITVLMTAGVVAWLVIRRPRPWA